MMANCWARLLAVAGFHLTVSFLYVNREGKTISYYKDKDRREKSNLDSSFNALLGRIKLYLP
jgi:hypothetical protein